MIAAQQSVQRALDSWVRAAFSGIFIASSLPCSQALSTPAHAQVTQTVGCQPRESITEETRGCGEEGFTRMKHIIEAIALGMFKNRRQKWQILK